MEFTNLYERRNLDRFKIPGAHVTFKTIDGQLNYLPIIDISKSSIRFRYTGNLSKGDYLNFAIIIPSKEKISLKGHVVAITKNYPEHSFVLVQFAPFGPDERYNPLSSLKQINVLISENDEILE